MVLGPGPPGRDRSASAVAAGPSPPGRPGPRVGGAGAGFFPYLLIFSVFAYFIGLKRLEGEIRDACTIVIFDGVNSKRRMRYKKT
ncbi:hypothetical protein SSAG_04129 [Streptomyces sp. Mg1]|nr:hypothetical protein SSAG_04129 [Streptomyces sp. Mg1]